MANLALIRELVEKNKTTIRDLANKINRNESTLQHMIRKGTTNTTTLELIAKELNVPAGIFFEGWSGTDEARKLREENAHLKQLLAEKERTISILLAERK